MRNQDFERIMDTWAEGETEAAPEMRPTAAMARLVSARAQEKRRPRVYARWAVAGTAIASLLVLVILVAALLQPMAPPGQQVALVGQREAFDSGGSVVVRGTVTPPRKGPGELVFNQIMFQFQKQGSRLVEGVDLRAPQGEKIALTSADDYRLLLEQAEDCHVHVFQLTAAGSLARLFPNPAHSAVQNPLRRGQAVYVPAEPNGFYLLGAEQGQEHLYVVASIQALPALDDLYARYSQTEDPTAKQEALASLLRAIETVEETHEAVKYEFVFNHQ